MQIPGGWVCVHSRTLWVSPTNSPVRLGVSPTATTSTGFIGRGFEALVSHAGTLGCMVCLTPQLFLPTYLHTNVRLPSLPAAASSSQSITLLRVLFTLAAHLTPPTSLDECFFFNTLVVGFPYSSIFWQFWSFFCF